MTGVSSITRTRPRDQKKRRALGTRMTQLSLALHWRLSMDSLPRSRFLDVTQRSPKRTAADIQSELHSFLIVLAVCLRGALRDIQKRLQGSLIYGVRILNFKDSGT